MYPKENFDYEELKFLLGIINSSFATFYIKLIAYNLTKGAFTKIRTNQLARLPVKKICSRKNKDSKLKINQYVDKILQLYEQLQTTTLSTNLKQIQRAISHSEKKIDELVYELYGLNKEDIEVIEKGLK